MKLTLVQQIALRACYNDIAQAQQLLRDALQRKVSVMQEIGIDHNKNWVLRPDGVLEEAASPNGTVANVPLEGAVAQ